jgi:hypothetical protein
MWSPSRFWRDRLRFRTFGTVRQFYCGVPGLSTQYNTIDGSAARELGETGVDRDECFWCAELSTSRERLGPRVGETIGLRSPATLSSEFLFDLHQCTFALGTIQKEKLGRSSSRILCDDYHQIALFIKTLVGLY